MSEQRSKKPVLLEVSNSQEVKEEPVSKSKKKIKKKIQEQNKSSRVKKKRITALLVSKYF